MQLAERMDRLTPSGLGKILVRVERMKAEGKRVIPMHTGEPDFPTPENIVEAGIQALQRGDTHYVTPKGLLALREAIAEEVYDTRSVEVDPERVIVVPGAKPMVYFALLALCQRGDEVICPDPAYPYYAMLSKFVGAKPVSLPLNMETGFSLDIDRLRDLITPRTRLITINSPSNPTGGVLGREELEAMAEVILENDLYVLADEIYKHILFEESFESIISVPGMAERTILVDGFSKSYAMTGWRLGYGVVPERFVEPINMIVLSTLTCTAAFVQAAGIEALTGPQESVRRMVAIFHRRRDQMVRGLNKIHGLKCLLPQGAFYAFTSVEDTGCSGEELCELMLTKAGVATYPGKAFGRYGEGFLRFSFACSEKDIDEGLERIGQTLHEL